MKFRGAVFTEDFSILRHLPFVQFSNPRQTLCIKLMTHVKHSQRSNELDAHKNKVLNGDGK